MVEALRRIRAEGLPLGLLTNNFVTGSNAPAASRPDLAEALSLTQPAISDQVRKLENPLRKNVIALFTARERELSA